MSHPHIPGSSTALQGIESIGSEPIEGGWTVVGGSSTSPSHPHIPGSSTALQGIATGDGWTVVGGSATLPRSSGPSSTTSKSSVPIGFSVSATGPVSLSLSTSNPPIQGPTVITSGTSHHATPIGPIVGGAIGGVFALLLLGGLILWCKRRRARFNLRSERVLPTPPLGELRSGSTLALDRPAPPAVIESQAAMLEKANALAGSRVPAAPDPISSSNPVTETQFRAMADRLAVVEAALTARDEDLPPNYTPG